MNSIIKIEQRQISDAYQQTVSARNLHAELEVGKDFSNWVKTQIERSRLVENRDYVVLAQKGENPSGGRPMVEYHLTIDAAKHIAMLSGTEKGFAVREYFIECERIAKEAPVLNPANFSRLQLIELAMQAEQERLVLESKVIEQTAVLALQAPKVEALDLLATRADGTMCITNAAKYLQAQPKRLFAWLQEHKWVYRRVGGAGLVGYQDKIQQGLLEHKITTVERSDGSSRMCEQVLVTAKGLAKLAGFFGSEAVVGI